MLEILLAAALGSTATTAVAAAITFAAMRRRTQEDQPEDYNAKVAIQKVDSAENVELEKLRRALGDLKAVEQDLAESIRKREQL